MRRSIGRYSRYGILSFISLFILSFVISIPADNSCAADITEGALSLTLDNGLNVLLKEDRSAPVVSVQVWVKTGSANETEEEAGITHFIEHMIFKGTLTKKTGEIARAIESSGGDINAYTSFDRTVYFAEIPSQELNTALDVLLDAIQFSVFDPVEITREKEVVLEEYRRSLDSPRRKFGKKMMALAFKKHPYGRPVIGYESTIRTFDRQAVLEYMNKWYTPENITIVVVGDFNTEDVLNQIKTLTDSFPDRAGHNSTRPVEPIQTSLRKMVIEDIVGQTHLNLSWHIPSLRHPHIPALDVMEIILGSGKSSRLYKRLRMDNSLSYSVHTSAYSLTDPGIFIVNSTLNHGNLDTVLENIAAEITRISNEPVTGEELERAKRLVEADFLFAMEDMKGQARALGFFETMAGGLEKTDEYLRQIQAVSAEDILSVADLYLKPSNLSIGLMIPRGTEIELSDKKIHDIFSDSAERYINPLDASRKKTDNPTFKYTLSSGLRIIIKENNRLPIAAIQAVMLGGMRLENPGKAGISNFTARMLTRGTDDMDAGQIAAAVDSWAGNIRGFSGRNSFGITANFLSKDLYPGLKMLHDLLRNSVFPESEIIKVKADILARIKSKQENPSTLLFELFDKTMYQNHPYGRPRIGTEETINSISRDDLLKWYKPLLVPSNIVLTVVGDVQKNDFLHKAEEIFRDLKPLPLNLPEIDPEPPVTDLRETHLEREGAQIHLMVGYLGTDIKSKNNAPMSIIDTALSGQGGRLFRELRDKQSLAYSVSSFRRPGLETGLFGIYIACEPKKLKTARDAVFEELEKIKTEGLTQQELIDAKKYLLGTQAIGFQTNEDQAMRMALDELYGLGYDHLKQYVKEIEEVTLEDLKIAVDKILKPNGSVISTVGPMP